MTKILLMILISMCISGLFAPAGARSNWTLRELLDKGMRLEAEGRFRGEDMYRADTVRLKGDRKESLRVEGVLAAVDLSGGTLDISGMSVVIDTSTVVTDERGERVDRESLGLGMRVRAHIGMKKGERQATTIRVLESRDMDTEITATVERVIVQGRLGVDIILLGKRFRCDESTAIFDPDGERMEIDFTELDFFRNLVDNDDERPVEQISLGEILTIGGEFQVDLIPEENFDLYDEMDSDVLFTRLSSRLEVSSRPLPDVDMFLKVAASEPVGPFDPFHPDRSEGNIRLAEANILWRNIPSHRLGLRLGRQDFDEPREWIFDENLDGIRLYIDLDPARIELSTSTNFSESTESDQGVVNYILYTSYEMGRKREFAAYIIHREDDDTVINFDRRWYGLRSFGRLSRTIEYWVELALLRGERRGRALDGRAFDVGFTHVMRGLPLKPSFTFGYAYASGDGDFRDNIDGNFRQTGFDDNNDNFNGVNSFKYYGEVFNPELSNIRISTVGAGFLWTPQASFDIVYHTYRQDIAENNVHGGDFLIKPSGKNKSLGDEIDLIAGYEKLWNIDIEFVIGFFRPGDAYRPFNDPAARTKLEIEYNF